MQHRLKSNTCFLDKSFQEDQTSSYVLSMVYSDYGITIVLYHSNQNKFIGFINYTFDENSESLSSEEHLEQLMIDYPWLRSSFSKVNFIVSNPFSTLIPNPLFEPEKAAAYLKLNQQEIENQGVLTNELVNNSCHNIYYSPEGLEKKVNVLWPNINFLHFSSALLEILAINFKNLSDNKQVFVHVHEDRFELVYFKDGKLFFHNSFNYKTKEDFLYFMLAAFEQLSINPEEAKLVFSGLINKEGQLYGLVHQYIRNCSFIERNEAFKHSHILDEILPHYYYVLFNALQCG